MVAPRVLLLATYPSEVPLHGGQRRVHAIARSYRQAGWEVKQIGVFPRGSYARGNTRAEHIELSREFMSYLSRHSLRTDLHVHHYFAQNPRVLEQFIAAVERFQPNVIQFEQPWLFPVLWPFIQSNRDKQLVAYSAHNVESALLQDILLAEGHPRASEFVEETRRLEEMLISVADVTVCVTELDAGVFSSMGAKNVVIAPNGADRRPSTASADWDGRFGNQPYAFMTGSAHPPNCTGFLHFVGTDFAFVPPTAKVVVAGGMAALLAASPAFQRNHEMVRRRVLLLNNPEEADLDYLINRAAVVLLPIAQGGGSNIKTAEALLSGRPIVASSTAFRGYEAFRNSAGVTIEDNVGRFRHAVRMALSKTPPTVAIRTEAESLLWERCVFNIPSAMRNLVRV